MTYTYTDHGNSFGLQVQHFNPMVVGVCYVEQRVPLGHTETPRLIETSLSKARANHVACFPSACQHLALLSFRVYNFDLN